MDEGGTYQIGPCQPAHSYAKPPRMGPMVGPMTAPRAQTRMSREKNTPPPRSPREAPPTARQCGVRDCCVEHLHPSDGEPMRPAAKRRPSRA